MRDTLNLPVTNLCRVIYTGGYTACANGAGMAENMVGQWTIVDVETIEDGKVVVVERFDNEADAVQWLDAHHDKAKVHRGGFGLDSPEE